MFAVWEIGGVNGFAVITVIAFLFAVAFVWDWGWSDKRWDDSDA